MRSKRILGYVLIIIGVILGFALLGQMGEFVKAIGGIFWIFSSKVDGYNKGLIIGHLIYWLAHVFVMIWLFRAGRKRIRKNEYSS